MPTKRARIRRTPKYRAISPAEIEFLAGEPQTGANRFELQMLQIPLDRERQERVRALLAKHGGMVPKSRKPYIDQLINEMESYAK